MVPLWLQVADHLPRCHKDPASLQLASGCLLQSCELDLQQEGVVVHTNRRLHNAALGSVTFSHLPPIKLSCYISDTVSEAWLLLVTRGLACILLASAWLRGQHDVRHHLADAQLKLAHRGGTTTMHASGVRLP